MKGIFKSVSKRDYYRYIIYTAEKTKTCRKMPSGSDANSGCQEVFIADMDQLCLDQLSYKPGTSSDDCWWIDGLIWIIYGGFSVFQVREIGAETTRMTQANYPEGTRRVFIINGNWIEIDSGTKDGSLIVSSKLAPIGFYWGGGCRIVHWARHLTLMYECNSAQNIRDYVGHGEAFPPPGNAG